VAFGVNDDSGWDAAPTDVIGAGGDAWAALTGIPATHPLVGGADWGPDQTGMSPDAGLSRIVTQNLGETAPMGAGRGGFDDWRDLLDFRSSPTPYILLALLAAIGFIHLRIEGRAGPLGGRAALG
jgi:hypothetical protein